MVKRFFTAVVLIGVVGSVLAWAPMWLFKILILLIIAGALREFYRMVAPRDYFADATGMAFGLIIAALLIFMGFGPVLCPIYVAVLFVLALAHMAYYTTVEGVVHRLGLILFGTAYISLTLPVLVWMRESEHGIYLIVLTIVVVTMGDTFAYSAGKLIGKHKLSPLISPNKTVEGFAASFIGGALGSLIVWQIFWPELGAFFVAAMGVAIALVGALGDLIESMIKRGAHVKDSGTILPGHGGILDRIDALIFAAPFVFYVFKFTGLI